MFRSLATLLLVVSAASAAEITTLDVITPSAAHPRHDHQLIFPLKDGRLLLAWCEYYVPESTKSAAQQRDDKPCRISAMTSADGGKTWGGKFTLQENTGKLNVKHPSLLRLPSGEVLLVYTEWNTHQERIIFVRRSQDDAKSWSEPVRVSSLTGVNNTNNDHAFRMSTGRIIVPAFNSPSVWDKNDHWKAFCYYSDDDGKTWQMSEQTIDLPKRGAEEPMMIERKDGSLLAVLRTSLGAVYRSESKDGGRTWSKAESTGLKAPASPPLLKRIPTTGDLLLVWNHTYDPKHHHQGERRPLVSAISKDDGATWTNIKVIEPAPKGGAAYPAVTFVGDSALLTYYYQPVGIGGTSGVRLKHIPIDWFAQP